MADATMTDSLPPSAAPNQPGESGGGGGGAGGAGGAGGGGGGRKKEERKKCSNCGNVHHPQVACWEVCGLCGRRHHFRAPCQRVQDPQRSLVDENRALHERNRVLEQELAHVRGQLHTQLQIANLLQQQQQGSLYSSPFLPQQPAMQPQAFQAPGMQSPAREPPRATGSFSGFGRSRQMATSRSEPSQRAGSYRGGKGSEDGGDKGTKGPEKQPKKMAEASKEKIAKMRKKQAEAKKQPAEKDAQSSTWADECNEAASTEGKKPSRGQRRRESRQKGKAERERKQKEAEGVIKEGAEGNTEAMDLDEEAQAPPSTAPIDAGEESDRRAATSTLAIRERSSEAEAGAVEPTVAPPQPRPQPQLPPQAPELVENSVPTVVDGDGAASGPSEPRQPEG